MNWLDQGIYVNQREGTKSNFSEGLMEYCQMENIQIQAWGPFAQGRFSGPSLDNESESVKAAAERIAAKAREKETTPEAIVLGWLMRHPAMIQPVIGTASVNRIKACEDAARQAQLMTKIEWNELYAKASGII